ncbi:MAG: hypothetical protein EA378_07130 [Phycisphaerales bacterium]|nr:MAG: hypothetical protein EA378_07130 [Phycisphaerales bacterium]
MSQTRTTFAVAIAAVSGLIATGAAANSVIPDSHAINFSHLPSLQSSAQVDLGWVNADITAPISTFQFKNVNGTYGVGIGGGAVHGEISGNESIRFDFSAPVLVTSLSLAHLYAEGNFGDVLHESATVLTDLGAFHLQVTSPTTAAWSGPGVATNLSIGTEQGGGLWEVAGFSIFPGAVNYLELVSGNPGPAYLSDYGFHSMDLRAVPIVPAPATAALGALGLGGLAARRRRA